MLRFLTVALCSMVGLFSFPTSSLAQTYPEKPIEMIVAFAPGGGTDVAARSIARFMEKHLTSARIAIINKPGAGGEIGWTQLARSKPDGYTIGFINAPAINALVVEGKAKFAMSDFQTIANLVYDPGILVVHKSSPFQTLADLIKAAKDAPQGIVIGTSGASGSSEHIALLELNRLANVEFKPAFFGGTAPVRQAILGNHVPAATMNLSEALALIREGEIRVLGIMSEDRSDYFKDALTFKEQGIDLIAGASRGIVAPRGVSPETVALLQEVIKKAMNDPEYLETAKKAEIPIEFLGPQEYRQFLDRATAGLQATWEKTPWK